MPACVSSHLKVAVRLAQSLGMICTAAGSTKLTGADVHPVINTPNANNTVSLMLDPILASTVFGLTIVVFAIGFTAPAKRSLRSIKFNRTTSLTRHQKL